MHALSSKGGGGDFSKGQGVHASPQMNPCANIVVVHAIKTATTTIILHVHVSIYMYIFVSKSTPKK